VFVASRALRTLEHFGIPHELSDSSGSRGLEQLRLPGGGPALLWPSASANGQPPVAASLRLGSGSRQAADHRYAEQTPLASRAGIPIFGRIASDRVAWALLREHGGTWTPAPVLLNRNNAHIGSIWIGEDGSVFLPFDPDEVRLNYLSERYQVIARGSARNWRRFARMAYYRSRGLMPRPVQIWLRRRYAPLQARAAFPRWPVETGLHDFLEFFFSLLQSIAGEPVPRIAAWPNGSSWALVLTHDVETAAGRDAMDPVLELERRLGLRSSWNFVPRRYDLTPNLVRSLQSGGFEVGVHGLHHDGRDLESATMVRARLPGIREAAERWNAVGFRSPATYRVWELMPLLGFDYDSSYPDTDPFEPQGGGCCTSLPFFNRSLVELPITMPQDHTLFVILRHADESAWVRKAAFLRSCGGMALLDAHPDYLVSAPIFAAYRRFLERFAHDNDAWRALPSEVSQWWRRRAQSKLERTQNGWTLTGPIAHEARVEFAPNDVDWRERLTVANDGPRPRKRNNAARPSQSAR
jgi:hypothetical protein